MGAVYLAEHPLIGKKVALKVIHRELAGNREVVQRFFQEAKAVNKIGNDHIVEIHDFGVTPEGDHFYIMEYLEGKTLAQIISAEKTIDVMRALHIGAQIAHALAAAHASGVIHRDLKPDNIMLMPRMGDPEFVKVLDFGLAKMFADGSGVKTAAGVLLGTPQYMSPEACESKPGIDHRTDVYALGILLFQMMTGRLPFDGESMGEVLVKQVTQLPPPPRGLNPGIPPSVEQILLRCLAKPVDARFQTMEQLRAALLDPESYLRSAPPIAAARSIRPGEAPVDARTVMMHAEAVQKAKLAGQPVPAAKTSAQAAYQAATMIGEGVTGPHAHAPHRPASTANVPDLAPPIAPKQNTMRIATPVGYSSRPPRKMWPIVLVMGLLLGLGGGAFAVAWFGRKEANATDAGVASGGSSASVTAPDAPIVVAVPDATEPAIAIDAAIATVAIDAAVAVDTPPAVAMAKVTIDSKPQGASVIGPDGEVLGKTPFKTEWPISTTRVTFELRLAGYKKKPTPLLVDGNTAILVDLERAPRTNPGGSGKGTGAGTNDNSLMRPD
ncbi:MAG: protein kinase [Myxococcota bacterium]|nr:protein kinase [Myxococcota bacterium]